MKAFLERAEWKGTNPAVPGPVRLSLCPRHLSPPDGSKLLSKSWLQRLEGVEAEPFGRDNGDSLRSIFPSVFNGPWLPSLKLKLFLLSLEAT